MKKEYSKEIAQNKYNLLTDDMLYNIIINLRNNNMSFQNLADELGITTEELLSLISSEGKDFFTCLECIDVLENKKQFEDYSRIKTFDNKNIK